MKDSKLLEPIIIPCDCHWLDHIARFNSGYNYDEDGTISIEILRPQRSFWERLRWAWKCVVGSESHIIDIGVSPESVQELYTWLGNHINFKDNK